MQAVSGIVFNSDRSEVLLIERCDVPVWVLPGGGIDPGETPENAVCRELHEETGYRVEIVRKIAEYLPINRLTQLTHFYECRIVGGAATTSNESRAVQFFPLKNFPRRMPDVYRHWIRDACQPTRELIRKKIEGASYWNLVTSLLRYPLLVVRFLWLKMIRS